MIARKNLAMHDDTAKQLVVELRELTGLLRTMLAMQGEARRKRRPTVAKPTRVVSDSERVDAMRRIRKAGGW